MITSLALKNFKSIHTEKPLEISNLTLICGSNSSGKSSIIQAILMLSQTFSSRYLKRSVSLNGKLVRLGSFTDILKHACSNEDRYINLEIEMEVSNEAIWLQFKKFKFSITFTNTNENSRKFDGEFHPEIVQGSISIFKTEKNSDFEKIEFIAPYSSKQNPELFIVKDLELRNKPLIAKEYPDYKIEGVARQNIVPYEIHLNYDHTKKISQNLVPYLIGTTNYLKTIKDSELEELEKVQLPKAVLDKIRSLINNEINQQTENFSIPDEILSLIESSKENINLEYVRQVLARQSINLSPDFISLPTSVESIDISHWRAMTESLNEKERKSLFDFLIRNRETVQGVWCANMKKVRAKSVYSLDTFEQLNIFLSYFTPRKIKYLGPLRNEPQAMYQAFDLSEPTMVGLKGENTAAVLHINKNIKINYPLIIETESGKTETVIKSGTLENACTEWLSYLGVVTEFRTYDKGKLGYELHVKTSPDDEMQDLTHVGVGVSQVLPIVVMALLSEESDILIFEQPELHLHPKVQSRLTDFFLAISKNRQCIIETHSEYIINRLRLRIAQSRTDDIRKQCRVLFARKAGKASSFKSVDITSYGSIIEWPEDFFDQTDKEVEKILLEAIAKKKEKNNSTKETEK